jgi:hypothetical protein
VILALALLAQKLWDSGVTLICKIDMSVECHKNEIVSVVAVLLSLMHFLHFFQQVVVFTVSGQQLRNVMSIGGCYQQNS